MRHEFGHHDGPRSGGGLPGREPGIPDADNQPIINAPAIVLWSMAVLAVTHGLRVILPAERSYEVILALGFIPARFTGAAGDFEGQIPLADLLGAWPTFLTHALVHGDLIHLGLNAVWLLAFGAPVARRLGTIRFLVLFAVCTVAGALAHLVVDPNGILPVVGASGAISGLMGAAARFMFSQRRINMLGWPAPIVVPLTPITDRRVLSFVAIWVLINLIFGATGLDATGEGQMIAWQAHLGGFFAGLFAISLIDPYRPVGGPEQLRG